MLDFNKYGYHLIKTYAVDSNGETRGVICGERLYKDGELVSWGINPEYSRQNKSFGVIDFLPCYPLMSDLTTLMEIPCCYEIYMDCGDFALVKDERDKLYPAILCAVTVDTYGSFHIKYTPWEMDGYGISYKTYGGILKWVLITENS